MDAQPREQVGVVVIHGVGETYAGWIDSYLVPQLEKWAAYFSVDGLGRRPETNGLMLAGKTYDDKYLTIGLENDDDFRNFCRIVADASQADVAEYKTAKDRLKNRDKLSHLIRNALDEKTAAEWLEELRGAGVPCGVAFSPLSEVYRVRDPESSDSTSTWESYTRRCRLDDRDLIVSELFWADMSKIGYTNLSRSSAIVQLFLESPFVLGETLLTGCDRGVHRVVGALIKASNWLMRWPIAGLTLPVFLTTFFVVALQQLMSTHRLPATVAVCLGVISVVAYAIFRKMAHRKVGLADLSLSTALFSFLLLIALAVFAFGSPMTEPVVTQRESYLVFGVALLLIAWFLWTLAIVAAAGLVTLIALKRLVLPGDRKPPLARPALAISLNMLLGMIWKLVLPLVGVLGINTLVASDVQQIKDCPSAKQIDPFAVAEMSAQCKLGHVKEFLLTVSVLNAVSIVVVALAVIALLFVRSSLARVFQSRALAGKLTLPRLITSPWIVATLFASACFNAAFIFVPGEHFGLLNNVLARLPDGSLGVGASVLGLVVIYFLLQKLIEMSNSIVHIGRDLVDHQYGADRRALTMWLVPDPDATPGAPADGFKKYRRRQRIQRRLEALIDEVIAQLKVDRLIFLAHSQGSVIMHDYLVDHDNLVAKAHGDKDSLYDVKRIDVVTVGSPLTHLYRHYFADYEETSAPVAGKPPPLMRRVSSWTNMWRIDDPIGQRVTVIDGIDNVPLPRGGHMDYWKDNAVCEKLWSLIFKPPQTSTLVHRDA